MTKEELDNWWCRLSTELKERIATKATTANSGVETKIAYPACTTWWNNADLELKQSVYDHCTDQHGQVLDEWSEFRPLSY